MIQDVNVNITIWQSDITVKGTDYTRNISSTILTEFVLCNTSI